MSSTAPDRPGEGEDRVAELERRVNDLSELHPAVAKLVWALADDDHESLIAAAVETSERMTALEERIERLETRVDTLNTDLPTSTRSKREKCFDIVRRVVTDTEDNAVRGAIGKKKAAGVADCSERHALNLFETIAEHEWATKNTAKAGEDETKLELEFGDDQDAFLAQARNAFAVEDES